MEQFNPTVRQVFDSLDVEQNGYIKIENFINKIVEFFDFEDSSGTEFVKQLLDEVDISQNGQITFEEFEKCFQTIIEKQGQPNSRPGSLSNAPEEYDYEPHNDQRGLKPEEELFEGDGQNTRHESGFQSYNHQREKHSQDEISSNIHDLEAAHYQLEQERIAMETVSKELEAALQRQDCLEQQRLRLGSQLEESEFRGRKDKEERQVLLEKIHLLDEQNRDTEAHYKELLEAKDKKMRNKLEKMDRKKEIAIEKYKDKIISLENEILDLREHSSQLQAELDTTLALVTKESKDHQKVLESALNELGSASVAKIEDVEKQRDEALKNVCELEVTLSMLETEATNMISSSASMNAVRRSASIVSETGQVRTEAPLLRSRAGSLSGELEILVQQLTSENRRLQDDLMEARMELANHSLSMEMQNVSFRPAAVPIKENSKEITFAQEVDELGQKELREALQSERETVVHIQSYLDRVLMLVVEFCPDILGRISQTR